MRLGEKDFGVFEKEKLIFLIKMFLKKFVPLKNKGKRTKTKRTKLTKRMKYKFIKKLFLYKYYIEI